MWKPEFKGTTCCIYKHDILAGKTTTFTLNKWHHHQWCFIVGACMVTSSGHTRKKICNNKCNQNRLVPEATPLQPGAVRGRGTSRSDWPPDGRCRGSTPCPGWRRRRSARRGAGRTAGPAGLSTGHLEWKAERAEITLVFTSGGLMEKSRRRPNVLSRCYTYPHLGAVKLHHRIALLATKH